MNDLPKLIARCEWDKIWRKLSSHPEEASIAIPVKSKQIVFPLHQAVSIKKKPVSRNVLARIIKAYPQALDINTILLASQNPRFSHDSMELLLDTACPDIQKESYRFATFAAKTKNVEIVELFVNRYPEIVKDGSILIDACAHGTSEMVQSIIKAGHKNKVGKGGGLFIKNENGEDALDVAIRLFNERDIQSYDILITCLQYANAARMGKEEPDHDYPAILAALDWCPRDIVRQILEREGSEISNTNKIGKKLILKAIKLPAEDLRDNKIPEIFNKKIFINACASGRPKVVQHLLEKDSRQANPRHSEEKDAGIVFKRKETSNALDVAISQFDEKNYDTCEVLRICVQYLNAAKMGIEFSCHEYPTIAAAVGLVPRSICIRLGKRYKEEMKNIDPMGKLALHKLTMLAEEECNFAKRLDRRLQFPLHVRTTPSKQIRLLESIPELLTTY